jgi:hypothetical protein
MKGCPDEVPCEEHQKNYWIEHYKLDLVSNYMMDKDQQNNNCCEKNNCNNPNKN